MATPQALRTAITDLATLANRDLSALWQHVKTADEARDALRDILPALVENYGLASATLTADWYNELRDLIHAKGRFQAIPTDIGSAGAESLAGWAVGPLYQAEPDWKLARTQTEGGLQYRIGQASRLTVMASVFADPAAVGWQRQGSGECAFCAMLISRGAVYSESTVRFAAHHHCKCSAVPAFGGHPRPVKPYAVSSRRELDAAGNPLPISAADRDRVNKWIANNLPAPHGAGPIPHGSNK